MDRIISCMNVSLWLILAVITGKEHELLFPTLALIPGAFLFAFISKSTSLFRCITLTVGSALTADLIWIIYETSLIDRTSHNLAPLELIATGFFAMLISLFGSGIGKLVLRMAAHKQHCLKKYEK